MDFENIMNSKADLTIEEEYLDDIEKCKNSNELVESVVQTLSNISQD
jgi:hypothetical protein